MASLTVEQLIKIIIGAVVVVVVIGGIALAFKDNIISFFDNLPGNSSNFILGLIK
jgi:hypothetical protein